MNDKGDKKKKPKVPDKISEEGLKQNGYWTSTAHHIIIKRLNEVIDYLKSKNKEEDD